MQNWKKGCVFGHIDKLWKEHDRKIKKNASKNAYLGSIFIPKKYVFRVSFESSFMRMISSLKYKYPLDHILEHNAILPQIQRHVALCP